MTRTWRRSSSALRDVRGGVQHVSTRRGSGISRIPGLPWDRHHSTPQMTNLMTPTIRDLETCTSPDTANSKVQKNM